MNTVDQKIRVLVFSRSYLVADFRENVVPLSDEFDFSFLTDGACEGTVDTREFFYSALKTGAPCSSIDAATEADVIQRCRLLRNIDHKKAKRLVHAMATALTMHIARTKPDVILAHWVDEYSLHLLSILSKQKQIRFVAYAASFFPGLLQFTNASDGRAIELRIPEVDEVAKALESVSATKFRQNYAQPAKHTKWRQALGVLRYAAKRIVFKLRSYQQRDPLNMHYNITPYVVDRRRFSDFPRKDTFEENWQKRLTALQEKKPNSPIVFLPLAYFPEASTDYWVSDTSILDYEKRVVGIANTLSSRCILLIKEHPHMIGGRPLDLYEQLKNIAFTILVDPNELSSEVLMASDVALLGGGSVGVEALLRGKPILTYCDTSFWFKPSHAEFFDLGLMQTWCEQIEALVKRFKPKNDAEKQEFIFECLRTTAHIRPGGKIWPLVSISELRSILIGTS